MKKLVLAGDVGGTKTDLGLYSLDESGPKTHGLTLLREQTFKSAGYGSLEEILAEFLAKDRVEGAAFGIPGPVIDERVVTTNLPWKDVVATGIAKKLGVRHEHVLLMNDLETTAYGALQLPEREFHILNRGVVRKGNGAVIAAGTGLGQAFLYWDGKGHRPSATEGGHTDFAPRYELEIELLRWLEKKIGGRVSYERVVSGPGLHSIFEFLEVAKKRPVDKKVRDQLAAADDPSAVIGAAGVDGSCATCVEALEMFVRLYGAQAGNLALTVMATGGVYIGGGIVTKILPKMITGEFMKAFVSKGRYEKLLWEVPVAIILNPRASRVGAAAVVRRLVEAA